MNNKKAVIWIAAILVAAGFVVGEVRSSGSSSAAISQETTLNASQAPAQQSVQPTLSNDNHYTNSDGNIVHSPAYSNAIPAGATARCGDGTYSFSQHRRGTCSHHGGVRQWLN